jgi:hypothetical protein
VDLNYMKIIFRLSINGGIQSGSRDSKIDYWSDHPADSDTAIVEFTLIGRRAAAV